MVSIIIPFQQSSSYLLETLNAISSLNYGSFEVILLPDQFEEIPVNGYDFAARVFPTGQVSPAVKRDLGAEQAGGKYLAFLDDDAYPAADWLQAATPRLNDQTIAAVGGPQITPENDGFWQQVSGAVFLSPLNGKAVNRYRPGGRSYEVDDWPSVNLIVRRDDFAAVGGFDSAYWPGEDTKLCLDLTMGLGKKIVYEPKARVYHHRRAGFRKHLKQVGAYGLHRGYFAKRYPETSFRLSYLIPSAFFIFVCFGWLSLAVGPTALKAYQGLWAFYGLALVFSTFMTGKTIGDYGVALAAAPYLAATHFWYGWRFIVGFCFTKELKSKLGR